MVSSVVNIFEINRTITFELHCGKCLYYWYLVIKNHVTYERIDTVAFVLCI